MEKLKSKVAELLRKSADHPLKMKEIISYLEIAEGARPKLRAAVKELVEAGEVVQIRGKRYGAANHMNLVAGTFLGHADGFGFVQPLPRPGQANLPDIFVSGRDIGGAMHGDRVVVRVATGGSRRPGASRSGRGGGRSGKPRKANGEIIRVLERAHSSVVGYFEDGKRFAFVAPLDERISQHLYINFDDTMGAESGQIVLAEITEYPSYHRNPEGKVTEILGRRGDRGLDTELLIRKHGLASDFPPGVLEAAEKIKRTIPKSEISRRVDLRELTMVTIDGADAKDYDDAVSIETKENGNCVLGVHIADVGYYVRPGRALDDEAFERATSIYLEDRVLPMLPEKLSNDMCSLRQGEDRLTMTAKMEIDPKGEMVDYDIFESVIRVNQRLTYDDVFAILEGDKELAAKYSDVTDDLRLMNKLARKLRSRRMSHGSLDFDFPEARAIFDGEGEVVNIILQRQSASHKLIEEFMLKANETVARHATEKTAAMIYRIHEVPDEDRMGSFREFLDSIGYHLKESDSLKPRGLQKISLQAKGKPEEPLINYLMLRSLKMARYSPENLGHFGLASEFYTHFTSPIRRYPDLMVHRILKALAKGGADLVEKEYSEHLERICDHCSTRERAATDAERESLQTKQLIFMNDKIGDEFDGRITGVQSYGLFVELTEFLSEGLVRVSSLEDDYYIHMEEKHCLLGEHKGKSYRLGDEIRVQVVKVDLDRRRMDFVVADDETDTGREPAPGRKAAPGKKTKSSRRPAPGRGKESDKKAKTDKKPTPGKAANAGKRTKASGGTKPGKASKAGKKRSGRRRR